MSITTGLAGLTAATGLLRSVRDAAKAGNLKPDEFAGRVGEIYDYIVDSKDALVEAKEEVQQLKAQLAAINSEKEFRSNLVFDANRGIYSRKVPDGQDELYCSACLDQNDKRIRLLLPGGVPFCDIHGYRR